MTKSVVVTLVMLALAGCYGETEEKAPAPATAVETSICASAFAITAALRECVRVAPDDFSRDGCFREADAVCGFEASR